MNANIINFEKKITGKATTLTDLTAQVNALNGIRNTCEPSADELAIYFAKVERAAADLAETWRNERISELLAMPRTAMWHEFLAHRECKSVKIKDDRKAGRFIAEENNKGRISYPELNDAFVASETARLEKAGELFDAAELTIANNRKFNSYAPLFFSDCYKAFIDHNLGKAAAGEKAYDLRTKKNSEIKGKIPSVGQLVADLNELVGYLLPDDFEVDGKQLFMLKKDVRTLGVALSNASKTELKAKGNGHAFNWLLNVIENRIEGKNVTVIAEKAGVDSIRSKDEAIA